MFRIVLIAVALLVAVPTGIYGWTRLRPHTVRSEIEIDAAPDVVWRVLSDLDSYPQWNPFIVNAKGALRVGATLTNTLSNHGGTMTFRPKVLAATPGRELRWIGRFGVPGVVDGEHYFLLTPIGAGRTRLVQGETFTGVLVPFAGGALDVEDAFAAMNQALKERAEKMSG